MAEQRDGGQVSRKRKGISVGVGVGMTQAEVALAARGGEGQLARAFPSVGGRCGDDGRRAEFRAGACELGGVMSG